MMSTDSRRPEDATRARAIIRAVIGDATLEALHKPAPHLDLLGVVAVWATLLACGIHLAGGSFGPSWILALLIQGFALQQSAITVPCVWLCQ